MKIKNRWHVCPVEKEGERLAPAVEAWMKARPAVECFTVDEIAAGVPELKGATREVINCALSCLGLECHA